MSILKCNVNASKLINIGAFIEFAAPLTAIALAILVRKRHPAFQLTLMALAFMLLAFPVIFLVFTEPANVIIRNATLETIPTNWEQLRNQWEYSHLARFFCHLAALSVLVFSILVETPTGHFRDPVQQPKTMSGQ